MSNTPTIYTPEEFARLRRLYNEMEENYRSLQTLHEQVQGHNKELLRELMDAKTENEKLKKMHNAGITSVSFPAVLLAEEDCEVIFNLNYKDRTPREVVTLALHELAKKK